VKAGDGGRLAVTGIGGDLTYDQLLERVGRTAAALRELGLQPEQRLVMFMAEPAAADSPLASPRE